MFVKPRITPASTYDATQQTDKSSAAVSTDTASFDGTGFGNYHYSTSPLQRKPENVAPNLPTSYSPAACVQRVTPATINQTGMPDNLKSGIENLSGMAMDNVRVHYNSSKPAQMQALAYAQGTDIHLAPGQEQHLPHEAWHVVQQAQGRVKPTMQAKNGAQINDDTGLEREADVMGGKAAMTNATQGHAPAMQRRTIASGTALQRKGKGVVQRMVLVGLKDDVVKVKLTSKRPAGGLAGGSQGDHITPFGVLQAQLANAVAEQSLKNAWDALMGTYDLYKSLPGWDTTPKRILDYDNEVVNQLNTKGDIKALQTTITLMLRIRNAIDLTSIKNGTKGHGEGSWLGGLQSLERKLQLGNDLPDDIDKADVIVNMVALFEHPRYNAMKSQERKELVVEQHAITIVDAFPLLSEHFGITKKNIVDEF